MSPCIPLWLCRIPCTTAACQQRGRRSDGDEGAYTRENCSAGRSRGITGLRVLLPLYGRAVSLLQPAHRTRGHSTYRDVEGIVPSSESPSATRRRNPMERISFSPPSSRSRRGEWAPRIEEFCRDRRSRASSLRRESTGRRLHAEGARGERDRPVLDSSRLAASVVHVAEVRRSPGWRAASDDRR